MTDDFYASVPIFDAFPRITDPTCYRPLPHGWKIGFTDVVHSTRAVAGGRFKAVNMAGAAGIAAVSNALSQRNFPFAFGGDGAVLAVSDADALAVADALARTANWVESELSLNLRVAMTPIEDVRAAGFDVTVARYAPSANVDYAMFAGGGVGWVERQVKGGAYGLASTKKGKPDLTGLSCRWGETPSTRGVIASILILPGRAGDDLDFRKLISQVLDLTSDPKRAGHPLPAQGPRLKWPPAGLNMEVAAVLREGQSRGLKRLAMMAETMFAYVVLKAGLKIGGFDAKAYKREVIANTDFRKFDDGLRMTLDCSPALSDELEDILSKAAEAGVVRYGMHRQSAALVTCIVPSATAANHVHFIDGAAGGYTAAAKAMKGVAQQVDC